MKFIFYRLELAVFLSGAIVMIFELVGSRILGPYLGTSIFVWTSLIGIILGSLSLGYYFGGRIADKQPKMSILSFIIFLSALSIGIILLIKDPLLHFFVANISSIRVNSIFVSLILFLPTSVLLGMVSPYAAKIRMVNLTHSGSVIGNLYALSTAGSIFGTFLSGFYLIPLFGTNLLLLILAIVLLLISLLLSFELKHIKAIALIVFLGSLILQNNVHAFLEQKGFIDIDTPYNRIWIYNYQSQNTQRPIKIMQINNENHSSMFLDSDELVNEYTKYYHLARHFYPDFQTTLMLGGAGYSFPKDFLLHYEKQQTIDVVEIDPEVTELAKQYFDLKENPRLTIYHEDGRVYLNRTLNKYDVIFGDAFSSHYSLPYQLTTKEAVEKKFDILNKDGVVILNIISSIQGEKGEFLRAEYATYKSVFPQVYLFPVNHPTDGYKVQNIILVALKSKESPNLDSNDPVLKEYLDHLWEKEIQIDVPVLTDDHTPVEYYIYKTI